MTEKNTPTPTIRSIGLRWLALLLSMLLLFACLVSCDSNDSDRDDEDEDAQTQEATDEEQIREKIEAFVTAYNSGDFDATLNCLTAKQRNAFKALFNLLGGVAGSYAGFDIDLSDLFSLGISTVQGDAMTVSIQSITVNDTQAVATTEMLLRGQKETIYFAMAYENGGWYISDMTDRRLVITPDVPNQSVGGTITPSKRLEFQDGLSYIQYKKNDKDHFGIIDTSGKLLYSIDLSNIYLSPTQIGNGATLLEKSEDSVTTYEIVNAAGNVTATFDDTYKILAHGDGLVLVYQKKDTVTEIQHFYGIIDSDGNWVQPLNKDKVNRYPCEERAYYAGDGVFAIAVEAWYNYYYDFLFWNANTGHTFSVTRIKLYDQANSASMPHFSNGMAFVRNSHDWGEIEGVEAPDFYLLYTNGTFEEYNMENKNFHGYKNGYFWYSIEDEENTVYITDTTSSDQRTFTLSGYPAESVIEISFDGEYGLVMIQGANGNQYVTLIDKNGVQQFEPIDTNESHSYYINEYSDGRIVYSHSDPKDYYKRFYYIVDEKGNVTQTDYLYLSGFSDGIALARTADGTYIYINTNNEQILPTITE
ncbi:MAG: hypothetical protein IJW30_01170 [Clostridia bacterium]|nr:hypothetical protein [Clostridia bacterium]